MQVLNETASNQWLSSHIELNYTYHQHPNVTYGIFPPNDDDGGRHATPQARGPLLIIKIVFYFTPVLVSVGIVANTVSCCVLLCSALKKFSSSHYLAAISIINNLYLLILLLTWLPDLGYNVYDRPVACQVVDLISNSSSFLSIWLAVAFSVDRYISICWPAEAAKMCTVARARIVVICFIILSLIIYLNTSLTVAVVEVRAGMRCRPLPLPFRSSQGLKLTDIVFNHMLPFTVIILLLFLMCKMVYYGQQGLSLWQSDPSQMSRVTIVYFITFLTGHLPMDMYKSIRFITKMFIEQERGRRTDIYVYHYKVIAQYLSHIAFATNFIVLITCYPLFRQYSKQYLVKHCCSRPFRKKNDCSPECIGLSYHHIDSVGGSSTESNKRLLIKKKVNNNSSKFLV